MVSLVLISHSKKIAEGLKELASQMSGDVKIGVAGGTDDGRIGTDPIKIMSAIEDVYSDDGVLMFYDLGSALMNAELALDMMEEKMKSNVEIVKSSLVEGAFVAGIEASIGKSIEEIKVSLQSLNIEK